jgi:hypothetical protein
MLAVLGVVLALAPATQAVEWTGTDSSEWTVDGNWDASYPNAAGAVANFGIAAAVNVSSPITVGQITDTGAGDDTFLNSLTASGTGSITFDNNGADALFQVAARYHRSPANTAYSVPMVLNDNLVINYLTQRNRFFEGPISGSGHLTLDIDGNGASFTMTGSSSNTYSGGTTVNNSRREPWGTQVMVYLSKDGALGTGDVTLLANSAHGPDKSAKVTITSSGGTEDRIDDGASLYLNHDATGGYTVLTLDAGVDETVAGLYFDDVAQLGGTWGATGSTPTPDYTNDNFFAGTGVLRVVIPRSAGMVLIIK